MRNIKTTQQSYQENDKLLRRYLNEIGKIYPLADDEEVQLAKEIRHGSIDALQKLVRAHLRFVVSIAKHYRNQGLPLHDLINEGNIGMIKAAQKFDETRGFKFITYAVWWIRQGILQAIAEQSKIIRLPLNKVGMVAKLRKAINTFEQEQYRQPTRDEMQEVLGVSSRDICELYAALYPGGSYDAPFTGDDNDDDGASCAAIMSDTQFLPDKHVMSESFAVEFDELFQVLSERDSGVVKSYYGIGLHSPMNLEDIGNREQLTRERIRQIKERGLRKIRRTTAASHLREYVH